MDVVDGRPPQRCWTEAVPYASSTWRRPLQVLMGFVLGSTVIRGHDDHGNRGAHELTALLGQKTEFVEKRSPGKVQGRDGTSSHGH